MSKNNADHINNFNNLPAETLYQYNGRSRRTVRAIAGVLMALSPEIKQPPAHQVITQVKSEKSSTDRSYPNSIWSGYVAINEKAFKAVEGRIKVPKIECTVPGASVAFWVGYTALGSSVEQTGITEECSLPPSHPGGPKFSYDKYKPVVSEYAWWAMFGVGGGGEFHLKISPGDIVDYRVGYDKGVYDMSVRDLTTDKSGSKTAVCQPAIISDINNKPVKGACVPSEVEWIVERPGASPLADFGTVRLYDNTATNYRGQIKPINAYGVAGDNTNITVYALNMVNGKKLDETHNLRNDGSFEVTWLAAGKPGGM
jgi:hypothetical protein